MAKPQQETDQPDIAAPAILRMHHTLETAFVDGPTRPAQPVRFRNTAEHCLDLAYHQGRIDLAEHSAGTIYRSCFERMGKSARDSTALLSVSGGNSSTPWSQHQVDAIRALQAIESHLGGNPWLTIVRQFCGMGYSANEAVRAANFLNPREVWEKIRLALNKLDAALARSGVNCAKFDPDSE